MFHHRKQEREMRGSRILIGGSAVLLLALTAAAQDATPPASGDKTRGVTTVRGCLDGSRGNYVVIEDNTSLIYVLKGVGNKLDNYLHHQVEVKGKVLPGTVKTGVRPEKSGSNPADTVHGVDGLPLQVADVQNDIKTIAKHCKAADQQ
jgi:hypothetical protein